MRTLIVLVLVLATVMLAGCAKSKMFCKRTLLDGTLVEYEVVIESFGQDLSASDISAALNPEGETTVSVGAIDNTMAPVVADVAAQMVELAKLIMEYAKEPAVPVSP